MPSVVFAFLVVPRLLRQIWLPPSLVARQRPPMQAMPFIPMVDLIGMGMFRRRLGVLHSSVAGLSSTIVGKGQLLLQYQRLCYIWFMTLTACGRTRDSFAAICVVRACFEIGTAWILLSTELPTHPITYRTLSLILVPSILSLSLPATQ